MTGDAEKRYTFGARCIFFRGGHHKFFFRDVLNSNLQIFLNFSSLLIPNPQITCTVKGARGKVSFDSQNDKFVKSRLPNDKWASQLP
jgi:hypothetical protein